MDAMNFIIIDDHGIMHDAGDKVLIEDDKITLTTELHEDMNQLLEQVLTNYGEKLDSISCSHDYKKYIFNLKVQND